jgi:predicted DNA-binding transcriptional regulator AlpA
MNFLSPHRQGYAADGAGPIESIDSRECCRLLGGIHAASWYRGIRQGRYPRPVKVGSLSRWLRSEVEACLTRMIEVRQ